MLDTNFWKKYFNAYDVLNSAIPYQELLEKIIEKLELKQDDLVFDAGSGTGNLSILIKQRGARVISLDYSPQGLKIHKQKDPDAKCDLGDITKRLEYGDDHFDKIVSNNVIYTIDRELRGKVFDEFYRVLKPGGKIVIANIRQGFSPKKIFFDHVNKSFARNGFFYTVFEVIKYSSAVIKVFYYNHLIKKEHDQGSYDFMGPGEHRKLLEEAGFVVKGQTLQSYSNQSYVDCGVKLYH